MKEEGQRTREPATHQHNEILANKTILTLNLKQAAGRVECQRQDQPSKNTSIKFKIAFIILTFQWRSVYLPTPPRPFPSCPTSVHYRVRLSNIYSLDWIAGFTY